jgi:hypothetical protein
MNFLNIIATLGFASIIGGLIYIGKKLQMLDDLKETSKKIKTNLTIISHHLIKHSENFNSSELQTFSPFQLTKEGKDFIFQVGFGDVFATNKKEFYDFIDNEKPKVKYDVEILAIKSIYALYERPFMKFLKIFFYNKPTRNIDNTAPTLGVYVRDKYLEVHREIIE